MLLFEGEYLNGKKNGKGKEYYKDKLKYEGEYLNGKKIGKGKEYYNGELRFDGEIHMIINIKENNILKVNWNMKENILMDINLMEKDMMKIII